jgi:outer membrane protein assembly factor BamB
MIERSSVWAWVHRASLVATLGVLWLAGMPSAGAVDVANPADPMDWPHWRGPDMNGLSLEKGLPEKWSPKGENLLWRREELASRSTPIVMNGRLYAVCRAFPETTQEGEKTVCADATTGDILWESIHNIFLSDAPAERVGWSSVVGDPETDRVYVLGLGCAFQCLDGKTGKVIWEHSMSEEYGMLSTYGGRTNFPVVFEDLVIISGVMTGWGDTAVPAHRFVAFDKNTGAAVWFLSTKLRPEDTTYSTPIFAMLGGQAAMVVGAGDGAIYAIQPRTGKVIWKYQASTRGINTTPVVDSSGIVYSGHSEQNSSDTTILGSIFAFDGNTQGEITEDQLLWKIPKRTVGRSSPIKIGDRLYCVEDGALLVVIDAKTGKEVSTKKLGRIMFGSLVAGDGKIYAVENTGRCYVLRPTENGVEVVSEARLPNGEEVHGSPIISHGRIYIPSNSAMYCIGDANITPAIEPRPAAVAEAPVADDSQVAHLQLAPVEAILAPKQNARFQLRAFNKKGQYLKLIPDATLTAEAGAFSPELVYSAPDLPAGDGSTQVAGIKMEAKLGDLTTSARARVVPKLPWKFDFSDGKVPPAWIGADYRHKGAEIEGEKALVKVSTIPKGTRSQAWMGWTSLHDYTIQADFLATEKNGRVPDMGLINQRYTLDLQGAQKLQIRSWTPRLELRFAKTIPFEWKANTWYTMKFQSENREGEVVLRGKVWPRGEAEPEAWSIEAADATPNRIGSPGLFGNATDSEFYLDNVLVTPNPTP